MDDQVCRSMEGWKKNGQGTLTYPSGGKYEGELKDGKKKTAQVRLGLMLMEVRKRSEWKDGKEVEIDEKEQADNSEEEP